MILSILIPTHNRINILSKSLESLYDSFLSINEKELKINVIVVDDGSKDGTSEMLKNNFSEIYVINGDGNYWWTKAINEGAKFAIENLNSDYCLFWNDDIFPEKNYFLNLSKILNSNNCLVVGSKIYDFKTKELWSTTMYFNKYTGRTGYLIDEEKYNSSTQFKWLTGMGVLVSKEIFDNVGYLDEDNFPQYFGDLDFTLRISKKGYEIFTKKELVIYNQTEYSSFVGDNLKSFIKSLKSTNIGSRYNMFIRYRLLKKHVKYFLWVISFVEFYTKYIINVFIINRNKNKR